MKTKTKDGYKTTDRVYFGYHHVSAVQKNPVRELVIRCSAGLENVFICDCCTQCTSYLIAERFVTLVFLLSARILFSP